MILKNWTFKNPKTLHWCSSGHFQGWFSTNKNTEQQPISPSLCLSRTFKKRGLLRGRRPPQRPRGVSMARCQPKATHPPKEYHFHWMISQLRLGDLHHIEDLFGNKMNGWRWTKKMHRELVLYILMCLSNFFFNFLKIIFHVIVQNISWHFISVFQEPLPFSPSNHFPRSQRLLSHDASHW